MMCALALGLPVAALPIYQVTPVGPSGFTSTATAIGSAGAVVGNYQLADGTWRAFLSQNGQSTTLAMPQGALQTWATAVGANGQAGGYTDSLQAPQGLIWDNFGTAIATAGNYVKGLNDSGDAAGMAIGSDGAGYAFLTRNGQMISLGQPAGGDWSSANAINALGAAAGVAMASDGTFRAFSVSASGQVSLLATLGGANSYGNAISDQGVVAGHAQTGSGALVATTWTNGAAQALGTLGGINSFAYAINAAGQVAGYSDLANGGTAAFLYDNGLLYDLNGLLSAGSGWQLLAAYGMNNNGQIVGRGIYDGREQAFLLTPEATSHAGESVPEPSSILLAGSALLAYFAIRSRGR